MDVKLYLCASIFCSRIRVPVVLLTCPLRSGARSRLVAAIHYSAPLLIAKSLRKDTQSGPTEKNIPVANSRHHLTDEHLMVLPIETLANPPSHSGRISEVLRHFLNSIHSLTLNNYFGNENNVASIRFKFVYAVAIILD